MNIIKILVVVIGLSMDVSIIQASTCLSRDKNQVVNIEHADEKYHNIYDFTHKHIAKQQENLSKPLQLDELLLKYQRPEKYIQDENKMTLYQRFTRTLPFELQDHVVSYLEPADKEKRDEKFREALAGYLEFTNPELIKQELRAEYFLRKYKKEVFSHVQSQYSDLCKLERHCSCVLYRAAENKNSEIVALAVACGTEIDIKHGYQLNETALSISAEAKAFGTCRFLLHNGASGKIYNDKLYTPLYHAIKYDSVKAVKMFQQVGIIVAENQPQVLGGSAKSLMYSAASTGALKVMDYLAEQGADLNWQDEYGETPLIRAAMYNYYQSIDKLLSLGADPLMKDKQGRTYKEWL